MATDPAADLTLSALDGTSKTVAEWLTMFHMAAFVLDPYTNESAWILDTATRMMRQFRGADCRPTLVLTCDAEGARAFLGPLATEFLVLVDPDRALVKSLGLARLPAFVHLSTDGRAIGAAEGWDPAAWRQVSENLAQQMSWRAPLVPDRGDPAPYAGTPALG